MAPITVDIVSDNICPWCFVGKRRLEQAMKTFAGEQEFVVRWHPFQLNPAAPTVGVDKRMYYNEKFGEDKVKQLVPFMMETFSKVGINYTVEGLTGNTFDSHRLVAFAGHQGPAVQDKLVEAIFKLYFEKGKYLGDKAVLREAADQAGIENAEEVIENEEVAKEEVQKAIKSLGSNVTGVPHYIINGKYHLSDFK
ncbi:hypothetical protein WJX73_007000 [Symbiochloris irregularis]|uniref:DSBA-like thioredoxin domain-containing protein n=1 Tax=Symbiochloris irregularis TaxID=706552 RepID=A0AAW1NVQ4_9CHLO